MTWTNHMEQDELEQRICDATQASCVSAWTPIQSLWSGYGQIWRVNVQDATVLTAVVKHVQPPLTARQPKGWNTKQSHQRKIHSYEVEACWYRDWSSKLAGHCRVANSHAIHTGDNEFLFVLEDLDAAGFAQRHASLGPVPAGAVLRWLARFHARFLNHPPSGLWKTGTYWHLQTRP
ncbi:MAG: choline kinase, partial [Planctomycetota bacterium]